MKPHEASPVLTLSVIIPTLNEEHSIGATLDAVKQIGNFLEIIVADGGSLDETVRIARKQGARVVTATRGRGAQLHAGARVARGDVIWFLHADTHPPSGAAGSIIEALRDSAIVGGNCAISFDGSRWSARFLTWLYPQLRRLGLCYGDSGIFVRREAYAKIGGFQPFPIFEDLDFVRRLRLSGRVVHLPIVVTTSSRRFEHRSFALTFARWMTMQALYWLGVHPRTLVRLYAPIRSAQAKTKLHHKDIEA